MEVAFVSGRLSRALYRDNGSYYVFQSGQTHPATMRDIGEMLHFGSEYESVAAPLSLESLEDALRKRTLFHNILFFMTSLMDSALALSTRVAVAQRVEFLLEQQTDMLKETRDRLLSVRLPVEYRVHRHEVVTPLVGFPLVRSLLQEVYDSQTVLDELWSCWINSVEEEGVLGLTRTDIEGELIHSGLFAQIVREIRNKDLKKVNSLVVGVVVGTSLNNFPIAKSVYSLVFLAIQSQKDKSV